MIRSHYRFIFIMWSLYMEGLSLYSNVGLLVIEFSFCSDIFNDKTVWWQRVIKWNFTMNFSQRFHIIALGAGIFIIIAQFKSAMHLLHRPHDATRHYTTIDVFNGTTRLRTMTLRSLVETNPATSSLAVTETNMETVNTEYHHETKDDEKNNNDTVDEENGNSSQLEKTSYHTLGRNKHIAVYNFTDRTKPPLCIGSLARFGNSLFQIAAIYALARQTDHRPLLAESFRGIASHFPNMRTEFGRKPAGGRRANERFYARYDPDIEKGISPGNCTVGGYLQSWKYFRDYFEETRWLFTFSDKIMESAKLTLSDIRESISPDKRNSAVFIGVHVRRGDKAGRMRYSYGHRIPNITYIFNAMDYFRQKYNNVHFVVCSDGKHWCRENLNASDILVPIRSSTEEHDLALLTLCDHTIMTVGTLGFWAGFLGGGDLVYFKHPFAPGTHLFNVFSHEDFFLPHWVGMEWSQNEIDLNIPVLKM